MTINIRFWHTICCWVGVCLLGMLFACSGSEELEDIGKPEQITYKIYGDWSNVQSETRGTLISAESGLGNGPLWITSKIHGTTTEYFSGESLSKSGSTWGTTGRYFWPATASGQSLDFLVLYPKDDGNWTGFSQLKYTVPQTNASQVDLMYATTYNQTQTTNSGTVALNLKHALSAISFKAKKESDNMTVKVSGIDLCKVKTAGTFAFPTVSTGNTNSDSYVNCWTLDDTSGTLSAGFSSTQDLTTSYQTINATDGVVMMLPQTLTAWVPANGGPEVATQTGAYLVIHCSAYSSGRYVIGGADDDNGLIYAPIGGEFEAGKHYELVMDFGLGYNDEGKPNRLMVDLTASIKSWSTEGFTPSPLYPN